MKRIKVAANIKTKGREQEVAEISVRRLLIWADDAHERKWGYPIPDETRLSKVDQAMDMLADDIELYLISEGLI
ncbi:hypothetical protein [Candidatus Poriferisocius sp.]|uniref:hypothetical protein n=1 Tax=Candidatus Poriferisocius sp. TaxID=3101276 RepID=UPI003B526685